MSFEEEMKDRTRFMDSFVTGSLLTPRSGYEANTPLFVVARRWNTWYPSYFQVEGGCYAIVANERKPNVTVIDPGFGFMSTLRSILRIEPQDISNLVVSHFHPDHIAGLLQFITLAFQTNQPCSMYLNPTSYDFFKRFQGGQMKIFELCCGDCLRIATNNRNFEITIAPRMAHHAEIGLRHQSLGLIIDFINRELERKPITRIGLMGDTDGREEYIGEYIEDYKEADVLVIHLGSFDSEKKFGKGNKHLYQKGVLRLLDKICEKRTECPNLKLVVLSEFGLELASLDEMVEAMTDFYNSRRTQMVLFLQNSLEKSATISPENCPNVFETAIFSKLAFRSIVEISNLDNDTGKLELAETQLAWSSLMLIMNREEHLREGCNIENWAEKYVPAAAFRQPLSEYKKSDHFNEAINNSRFHHGITELAGALLWGADVSRIEKGVKREDASSRACASIKEFCERLYKLCQDLFYGRFKLSPFLYSSAMRDMFRFVSSLGMLKEREMQSIRASNFKDFSRLGLVGAALLNDLVDQSGVPTLIDYRDNCLVNISDFFSRATRLNDLGIKVLPGARGMILSLSGSRPFLLDRNGELIKIDKITASLTTDKRFVDYAHINI